MEINSGKNINDFSENVITREGFKKESIKFLGGIKTVSRNKFLEFLFHTFHTALKEENVELFLSSNQALNHLGNILFLLHVENSENIDFLRKLLAFLDAGRNVELEKLLRFTFDSGRGSLLKNLNFSNNSLVVFKIVRWEVWQDLKERAGVSKLNEVSVNLSKRSQNINSVFSVFVDVNKSLGDISDRNEAGFREFLGQEISHLTFSARAQKRLDSDDDD